MDLVEFLLARIAEDEEVARDIRHHASQGCPFFTLNGGGAGHRRLIDPARVLAECEAKRGIIEAWTTPAKVLRATGRPGVNDVVTIRTLDTERDADILLGLMALPHADHPEYRQEWRP